MIQMNLSMKQKQIANREKTYGCEGRGECGRDGLGVWG